jgi:hypothetical protein
MEIRVACIDALSDHLHSFRFMAKIIHELGTKCGINAISRSDIPIPGSIDDSGSGGEMSGSVIGDVI